MFNSLTLPPYDSLIKYEGKGNYAIWKYYKFPYSFFYRHKLKMMVAMMDKGRIYRNCLDFGSGPGIFTEELRKHSLKIKQLEKGEAVDPRWKFDLVVCASVLEFVELEPTLVTLKNMLTPGGQIIIASPMESIFSRFYFNKIKDSKRRHHPNKIIFEVSRKFRIVKMKEWLGLYFCIKAVK